MEDIRLESFPFDSKLSGYDDYGYPVYDRAVGASMLRETFKTFFSNGVFGEPSDGFLTIGKGSGLNATITKGIFIIDGAMGYIPDGTTVKLDSEAPQGKFAYGIFLRYDENSDKRSCYISVRKGEASSSPTPPEPETGTGIKELRLGYVVVPSGASDLSSAVVTNEKGLTVCPFAAPFVEIDVNAITVDFRTQANEALTLLLEYFEQYREMIDSAIDGTLAGQLQEQINQLKEKLDNFDLSQSVDNETIAYDLQSGQASKSLRVINIPDSIVTTQKIADKAVTTQKLADSSVTMEKLGDDVKSTILLTSPLGLLSWSQIKEISDDTSYDEESLIGFVGQSKFVNISGYGTFEFVCIGVRHDQSSSASRKAAFTFMAVDIVTTHAYNSSSTTSGGWGSSAIRTWMNGTLLNSFPSDLKSVIFSAKKEYLPNSGGSVSTSNDKLWLASGKEISGDTRYGDEGDLYHYWSQNNREDRRVKYLGSLAEGWWLRSVFSSSMEYCVYDDGRISNNSPTAAYGVVPCFCV